MPSESHSVVSDCLWPHGLCHGHRRILLARILVWVAVPFSRISSQPRDGTQGSCIKGRFFSVWATRESLKCLDLSSFFKSCLSWFSYQPLYLNLSNTLDCKEIQPVHPKGDQSWVVTGRTDAEAETPMLWPLHVKSWLIGKDPDAGRDWGQEEKGMTEDEMAGWNHQLNGHEFE